VWNHLPTDIQKQLFHISNNLASHTCYCYSIRNSWQNATIKWKWGGNLPIVTFDWEHSQADNVICPWSTIRVIPVTLNKNKADLRAKLFQPSSTLHLLSAALTTDGAATCRALTALRRTWSGFSAHAALVTKSNQSHMHCLIPQNQHTLATLKQTQFTINYTQQIGVSLFTDILYLLCTSSCVYICISALVMNKHVQIFII